MTTNPSFARPTVADCVNAAARYLATEPAAIDRALARHVRRPDGRCAGCGSTPETWPCVTASSALQARELLSRGYPIAGAP